MRNILAEIQALSTRLGDVLPGGKADLKTNDLFDKEQLAKGKQVEMEHTSDPSIAEEISRDHLTELPDYYTRLEKMEKSARYTIDDVIETIQKNESDFLNEDGLLDRQYIMERFNLNKEQYQKIVKALNFG